MEQVRKKISDVFFDYEEKTEIINCEIINIKMFKKTNKLELVTINTMYNIDGRITNTNDNYLTIMNDNLELLKKELYK